MSKTEIPRLSPSIAHKLTAVSPLQAWASHRLLGNFRKPPTTAQLDGRMWHAAVLEGAGASAEGDDLCIIDVDDFKTKAARELRDEAIANGQVPVVRARYDLLAPAAERIRIALAHKDVPLAGAVERRIEWSERTEKGAEVLCSAVLDHVDGYRIDDLKTGPSATPRTQAGILISRSHSILQDAAYRSALAAEDDLDPERIDFVYAFAQTEEPFSVTPVRMSGTFREVSHLRWRRAVETWHECLSKGTDRKYWPDATEDGIGVVDAPGWLMSQEIELEAMRDE